MKLAILQNPDVIGKNRYRIWIQRPNISKDLLVSSNAQEKGQILLPFVVIEVFIQYQYSSRLQKPDNFSNFG